MTTEACWGKKAMRRFTNDGFFRTFDTGELSPREAPVTTWHQVLPCQQRESSAVISSPRKVLPSACNAIARPFPTSLVLLSPSVAYSSHMHSLHSYIHALILSQVRTFMHTKAYAQHQFASVTRSSIWSCPLSSILNCFKWSVLNNGQLEFTFLSCFKWLVLNNRQLEFTFRLCFRWSVLTNGQLEFTFLSCFKWLVLKTMDSLSQVVNPKQRTTVVYLFVFVSSGQS